MRLFLFLDYDGTLVPIAPTPDRAVPPPALLRLLHRLVSIDNLRVAVISGRDLQSLRSFLPVPGLYLAANHGGLIQLPGSEPYYLTEQTDRRPLDQLARETESLIAARHGFLIELKELSIAFHYRLADPAEVEPVIRAFTALRERHCPSPEWEMLHGHRVFEVRPVGINKGAAVLHLLEKWPGAYPVYIGDDATDEDAFRALAGRGRTILVADAPRPTAAQERWPRTEVLNYLQRLDPDRSSKPPSHY